MSASCYRGGISGMMSSRASMAESSVQGKKRMPRWYKEGRKRCLWWEHGQPGRLNSTSPSGRTSRKIKVSPSHSSVVLPSSPGHPASSLEVSLTGKQAHLWNGKEFINGGWCTAVYSTYIICTQCCHDLGLTRSDPDPSSSDLTLTDG